MKRETQNDDLCLVRVKGSVLECGKIKHDAWLSSKAWRVRLRMRNRERKILEQNWKEMNQVAKQRDILRSSGGELKQLLFY